MGINLDTTSSFPIKVNTNHTVSTRAVIEEIIPGFSTALSHAYINEIDPAALAKSMDDQSDSPLSDTELKQLFSVYTALGKDDPLWNDISNLLTEFSGNDRTNFLSVVSRAGSNLKGFVSQLANMDEEHRSTYLRTAVRLDPKNGLKNLINSVKHLSGESLTNFIAVADGLGRSQRSLRSGELSNFMTAAAKSPQSIDALTKKTANLQEKDRAFFLKAAASTDGKLYMLINISDKIKGKGLTLFLKAASKVGQGLSNFLNLTQKMDNSSRNRIVNFMDSLSDKDAENFSLATQGLKTHADSLLKTAQSMTKKERTSFLQLAAIAGENIEQFITVINELDPKTDERLNFLSTAILAENKLSNILDIAQDIPQTDRSEVFSFTAELSLVDLSSFISAAKDAPSQTHDLATTAKDLQGKNKSYLLYAASLTPDKASKLADAVKELEETELGDFLFLAANKTAASSESMGQFLEKTASLSPRERADFLSLQKKAATKTDQNPLAKEYVFLKSAFTNRQFTILMEAGSDGIDNLTAKIEAMDAPQRDVFFTIAAKTKKEDRTKLISVIDHLDDKQLGNFIKFSKSLNKENLSSLIKAADLSLDSSNSEKSNFDRLIERAKDLKPASRGHFLNAAANSGKSLEILLDLTDQLGPWVRTDFLIAADRLSGIDDGQLLTSYLKATDAIINDIKAGVLESNESPTGIRPSQIRDSKSGIFGDQFLSNTQLPEYFKSAVFVASNRWIDYEDQLDWYKSFI